MDNTTELEHIAEVFALDYEGRGVAKINGKTVFIEGALPTEQVSLVINQEKKHFSEARVVNVLRPSVERVQPKCSYFDTCGGCVLQHASAKSQVAFKQRILEEQLEKIGGVKPDEFMPPIYGLEWAYRNRVRFSISTNDRNSLIMGFKAKYSHNVIDIESCEILPKSVSDILPRLKAVLQKIVKINGKINYIECFVGERVTVLNVCMQEALKRETKELLKDFSDGLNQSSDCFWQLWVQINKEVAFPFYPDSAPMLSYGLPEYGITMPYLPGDFTQVNMQMNALMINRALVLMDAQKNERVVDLFCGLGNFTLPMAKSGAQVVGIEGADYLVRRASKNACLNKCNNIIFKQADLFKTDQATVASWGRFDKMLLDPPRSGAYALVKSLHNPYLPKRIVYVSCNPSTLARDAAVLVGKGYHFKSAGVMNMFAQTAHVEAMAWFELH
ncbi:23S rRNA (uracil(1939)-C(5))-methyltransferase RlmD [Neisseria zoodegmatis]|uniref:23S rRNA (uracil(1939)-C(5))-methyltransferase RlmD n=1 Tax=Neisseria zoodegmatis TaxID=326523 RepID=A0AB38DTE0_9NEIS|nr:23S rRNA (uracil(1939)-C(5))-methyltransferase RlmD [Neisseria zoodegmatis]OSI11195.1 23S rRNA (uracil(1939)-C(5))-methyltransferase [Neisseria zoodegmatis]SNU80514.1 tRNA methyltransferase [Neisseria zoodegmatis]